jgi:hypothetical protein
MALKCPDLYSAHSALALWSRWAWGLRVSVGVNRRGAVPSADLGGSSNYSIEKEAIHVRLKTEVEEGSV